MKAMILAAGEGRRMRPLTEHTPKPLLKIGELCLIEHHIMRLKAVGIREFVINVAYLGQQIMDALGNGKKYGVSIVYSIETLPLETGGALHKALPLITSHDDSPFLLVNGDVWTDFDFTPLTEVSLNLEQDACLVLVDNPEHNIVGDFQLQTSAVGGDENVHLVASKHANSGAGRFEREFPCYTFSGISLLHPRLLVSYPHCRNIFPLKEVFDYAIGRQKMVAIHYSGEWVDIGTPERLQTVRQRFHSTSTPRAY